MKNKLMNGAFTLFLFWGVGTKAQEISNNAVGIRLSNQNRFSTEISWQHKLKDENRLEFGLAFDDNQFLVSGLYQWVYELKGDFNWYFGVGGVLEKQAVRNYTLAAAGDLGIEYNFEFPLQLSFDVRPSIGLLGNFLEFSDTPLSLGARYRF